MHCFGASFRFATEPLFLFADFELITEQQVQEEVKEQLVHLLEKAA